MTCSDLSASRGRQKPCHWQCVVSLSSPWCPASFPAFASRVVVCGRGWSPDVQTADSRTRLTVARTHAPFAVACSAHAKNLRTPRWICALRLYRRPAKRSDCWRLVAFSPCAWNVAGRLSLHCLCLALGNCSRLRFWKMRAGGGIPYRTSASNNWKRIWRLIAKTLRLITGTNICSPNLARDYPISVMSRSQRVSCVCLHLTRRCQSFAPRALPSFVWHWFRTLTTTTTAKLYLSFVSYAYVHNI